MDTDEHRWIENSDKGWLGHSEAVPQMAEDWGFATLSHQPPTKLLLLSVFICVSRRAGMVPLILFWLLL